LIALDIDGTMIGEDRVVKPDLVKAIARIQAKGAIVSIATGRPRDPALAVAEHSGSLGPVICFQGAMTFDQTTHKILRHVSLDENVAIKAIEELLANVSEVMMFLGDHVWVQRRSEWISNYGERMGLNIREVEYLESLAGNRPTAIVGVGQPEVVGQLAAKMRRRLRRTALVTHSLPMLCEIEAIGAGKDLAIAHLAETMGIASANVIAVGDGKGDQSMIEWAGLGVAVTGGHPDTVRVADMVIEAPEQSGLANFLERLCDQEKIAGYSKPR
jgi:Cof subfamily protein (haloacid dehalogenase superfamily)